MLGVVFREWRGLFGCFFRLRMGALEGESVVLGVFGVGLGGIFVRRG